MRREKSMHIRSAFAPEATELSALAMQSKAHWGYCAADLEAWRDDLCISERDIASSHVYVASSDDVVQGFYLLRGAAPDAQRDMQLEHLWVSPSQMGKGVGRALLAHATAKAAALGALAITIDADPHAQPFYLACGAITVGAIAAPLPNQADRVRPQMLIRTQS